MNDDPLSGRQLLAIQRLQKLIQAHGVLAGQMLWAMMSMTGTAALQTFSDEEIEIILKDAKDVEEAAKEFRDVIEEIAGDWRAQRQEVESK